MRAQGPGPKHFGSFFIIMRSRGLSGRRINACNTRARAPLRAYWENITACTTCTRGSWLVYAIRKSEKLRVLMHDLREFNAERRARMNETLGARMNGGSEPEPELAGWLAGAIIPKEIGDYCTGRRNSAGRPEFIICVCVCVCVCTIQMCTLMAALQNQPAPAKMSPSTKVAKRSQRHSFCTGRFAAYQMSNMSPLKCSSSTCDGVGDASDSTLCNTRSMTYYMRYSRCVCVPCAMCACHECGHKFRTSQHAG